MNATEKVLSIYTIDELKEIADHGCESGVCRQHIYYGDTIEFFTKYPDEITEYIKDVLGVEALKDVFDKNDANLDMYMNDLTWTFIELVAMHVVDDYEDAVPDLKELAAAY